MWQATKLKAYGMRITFLIPFARLWLSVSAQLNILYTTLLSMPRTPVNHGVR